MYVQGKKRGMGCNTGFREERKKTKKRKRDEVQDDGQDDRGMTPLDDEKEKAAEETMGWRDDRLMKRVNGKQHKLQDKNTRAEKEKKKVYIHR